jgi:hypothetical protein
LGLPTFHLRYWTSDAQAEVDFLVQTGTNVLPMEVKSSINVKSRSLQVFREKYHPPLMLRSSLQNLRRDGDILNIPLYCLFYMHEILDQSFSSETNTPFVSPQQHQRN